MHTVTFKHLNTFAEIEPNFNESDNYNSGVFTACTTGY